MKKKLLSILLAVGMTVSLAACGGNEGNSSNSGQNQEQGNSGKKGSGTITVAIWDNNQLKGLQQIADEWSETSGYDVDFQVMDWATYWTMLEAGVSGGEVPDVFWMHSAYAQM